MITKISSFLRCGSCALALFGAACGSDDSDGTDTGAASNDGSVDQRDGAVASGDASIDAARDGAADSGPDPSTHSDASIDDVDLALGGFQQDLAAPSVDCVNGQDLCLSVSGTYNGTPFDLTCKTNKVTVGRESSHRIGCRSTIGVGDLWVELDLDPNLIEPPVKTFTAVAPSAHTFVYVFNADRGLESYSNDSYQLTATHDQALRIAGISELVKSGGTAGLPLIMKWRIRGAFGLTLTPKSTCTKDSMGRGCDEVKLRASFLSNPIKI